MPLTKINSLFKKVKKWIIIHQADIILFIGVILISLLSFTIGYILAKQQEKEPIQFENSKHEIRNPKQIPISQITNPKHVWNIGKLEFRICFEFRDSNFEFNYESSNYWSRNHRIISGLEIS